MTTHISQVDDGSMENVSQKQQQQKKMIPIKSGMCGSVVLPYRYHYCEILKPASIGLIVIVVDVGENVLTSSDNMHYFV